MKMNATKLTIALVALLLALTCVFAACGKKNETPVDDNPAPVDDKPVVVDTVAKEDLNAIAESLKADYAANYVDLYSAETATAIEAEKSAALVKIFAATSKEEAQKVAADFISYLKSQKTIINTLAALVEKIGDVSLQDADALNELADVVAKLDAAYAGNNAAKKAALDAYKADTATQKTIKDIVDRFDELKAAKKAADAKDGINAQIAALKADFTAADKEFALADFKDYDALSADIATLAAKYGLAAGSEAYDSVFDTAALKAAKAALDAAFAKDPVLAKMQAVVDAAAKLSAAADAAQWREYIYVDASTLNVVDEKDVANGYIVPLNIDGETKYGKFTYDLKDSSAGVYTTAITLPDGAVKYYNATAFKAYATEEEAAEAGVKKTAEIEAVITVDYKLALKADVEEAVKVRKALYDFYAVADLTPYGYTNAAGDPVFDAKALIDTIEAQYTASVVAALADYSAFLTGYYTNVKLVKGDTYGTYSLQAEFDKAGTKLQAKDSKVSDNKTTIKNAIDKATENFTSMTEKGNPKDGSAFYTHTGDYYAAAGYGFDLVAGVPTISFTAWTYEYKLGDDKITTYTRFDALEELATTASRLSDAKAALRWLKMYIGDGEYADKYDFSEYKAYAAGFNKKVLYMTDRDVTEVAVPGVVSIRDNAVNVAKDETALGAKVLSPYTMALALVDEAKKVADAKDAAREEIKAAGLALRAAGDADAVIAANDLLTKAGNGRYAAAKLGYTFADLSTASKNYLKVTDAATTTDIVLQTKPNKIEKSAASVITDAYTALKDSITALKAAETADVKLVDLLNAYGVTLAGTYYGAGAMTDTNDDGIRDTYTLESIDYYATAQDNLAYYAKLYADYVAEATRKNAVAEAGVAAYVITKSENTALNKGTDYTAKELKRVKNLQNIFTSYESFKFGYDADNYLVDKADLVTIVTFAQIGAKVDDTSFDAFLAPYQGATLAADHAALTDFLYTLAGKIDYTNKVIKLASEVVDEDMKKAEKNFADLLDEYKGIAGIKASGAKAAATQIGTAKSDILKFANNYLTDAINLKITVAFGEDKLDFDFLTEVFREQLLANSMKVIDNVIQYADDLDKATTNLIGTADPNVTALASWKSAAEKRIDDTSVAFAEVTSIQAANKSVSISNLSASTYSLNTAATLLSQDVVDVTAAAFKE